MEVTWAMPLHKQGYPEPFAQPTWTPEGGTCHRLPQCSPLHPPSCVLLPPHHSPLPLSSNTTQEEGAAVGNSGNPVFKRFTEQHWTHFLCSSVEWRQGPLNPTAGQKGPLTWQSPQTTGAWGPFSKPLSPVQPSVAQLQQRYPCTAFTLQPHGSWERDCPPKSRLKDAPGALASALTSSASVTAFTPAAKKALTLPQPPLDFPDTSSPTEVTTDRGEASRRPDLLPSQEHRRQQQTLCPCLFPTVLPSSNIHKRGGKPI